MSMLDAFYSESPRVTRWFPYETARVSGVFLRVDSDDHTSDWKISLHRELAARSPQRMPDNKEVYELTTPTGDHLYVSFWDGVVTFAAHVTVMEGREHYVRTLRDDS